MIPSRNRPDVKESDYPRAGEILGSMPKVELGYVCDCCGSEAVLRGDGHGGCAWDWNWNPRLVRVGGRVYYGCSRECARTLFSIHHQYAMRDTLQETRFVKDKESGIILDLDRVVMATKELCEVGIEVVKFYIDPYDPMKYVGFRAHVDDPMNADAYIKAWMDRPNQIRGEILR